MEMTLGRRLSGWFMRLKSDSDTNALSASSTCSSDDKTYVAKDANATWNMQHNTIQYKKFIESEQWVIATAMIFKSNHIRVVFFVCFFILQ